MGIYCINSNNVGLGFLKVVFSEGGQFNPISISFFTFAKQAIERRFKLKNDGIIYYISMSLVFIVTKYMSKN